VYTVGSGSPVSLSRAGPCTVVSTPYHLFVVDSGPGSTRAILQQKQLLKRNIANLTRVLITHMHSDHVNKLDLSVSLSSLSFIIFFNVTCLNIRLQRWES
jgi:ribonuclease Z